MPRPLRALALSFVLPLLTGCSTHPLPQDFSRKDTFQIVQKARCEAKQGIFDAGIENHEDLSKTTIGFDFTFRMTEKNQMTEGKLSFLSPAHGGSLTLGLRGGADKLRHNERVFRVVDNLADLKNDASCKPENLRENFLYPMAGAIGLNEIVETFAKLRGFTPALEKFKDTDNVLSDKIEFTTTLTAGITPTLKVDSGVGSLHLTDLSINGNVERVDFHAVTVAIARTAPSVKKFAADFGQARGVSPYSVSGAKVIPPSVSTGDGENSVINELDRLRYIDRLREFPVLRLDD